MDIWKNRAGQRKADQSVSPIRSGDLTELVRSSKLSEPVRFWQQLSLRTKVALFAVAISALPLIGVAIVECRQIRSTEQSSQNTASANNSPTNAQALLFSYLGVAGVSAILVGGMAAFLTSRVIRPVLLTSTVARKLGQGHLETRLAVQGKDELAVLASNINWMADQFQARLQQQSSGAEQIQFLKEVTVLLAQSQASDDSLNTIVQSLRQVFHLDRVLIYRINATSISKVAESTAPGWSAVNDSLIAGFELGREDVECIADVASSLPEAHRNQLEALSVKAMLSAPIVIDHQILGVLIAHRCSNPYVWQSNEMNVCAQIAAQLGLAWKHASNEAKLAQLVSQAESKNEEYHYQQDKLQAQLGKLLEDVEQAAVGDLTVRAAISINRENTNPLIETCHAIAAAFNVMLENLQPIVTQSKHAADQLSDAAKLNEQTVSKLNETATDQTETLIQILNETENLMFSLQATIAQIEQASTDIAIILEVAETQAQAAICHVDQKRLEWRNSVTETVEQLDRCGQESYKIAGMLAMVDQVILHFTALALNASMNASRSATIHGFTVSTAQLSELSNSARSAIKQAEQFTLKLQPETHRLIEQIDHATLQLPYSDGASDPQLDRVRIAQLQQVMHSIALTTQAHAHTAQFVLSLMQKLPSDSNALSSKMAQVTRSLQRTIRVAEQIQDSLRLFKVKA